MNEIQTLAVQVTVTLISPGASCSFYLSILRFLAYYFHPPGTTQFLMANAELTITYLFQAESWERRVKGMKLVPLVRASPLGFPGSFIP